MKRKLILMILLSALALSLPGCSGNGDTSSSQSQNEKDNEDKDSNTPSAAKVNRELVEEAEAQDEISSATTEEAEDAEDNKKENKKEDKKSKGKKDKKQTAYDEELTAENIGPAFFTPNINSETGLLPRGGDTLHVYFKRTGVKGSGRIYIHEDDDSLLYELDLSDRDVCYEVPDDGVFSTLKWDSGTHLRIVLPKPYENAGNYYVLMDEGAFSSQDGKIKSKAVKDDSTWRYDVQNFGVTFFVENGGDVYVGDEIFAKILIRKPAKKALIEDYDVNRLSFNEKEFKGEDGDLKIQIQQLGEDSFNIKFYGSDRELISVLPVSYFAEMPPDPEEQKIKDNIVGL